MMGDAAGQAGGPRSLRGGGVAIRVSKETRDRLRELADAKSERLAQAGATFRQITFDEIINDLITRRRGGKA